jgi:hypothetical protein
MVIFLLNEIQRKIYIKICKIYFKYYGNIKKYFPE